MRIIGTISGSSLDGLDIALVQFDHSTSEPQWQLIDATTVPFNDELRERLRQGEDQSVRELCHTDVLFARFSAKAVKEWVSSNNHTADYIASHGHTITHHPEEGYSLQIGSGAIIAEQSGLPTICDFRMNDIALGGQGAPIAPIVEQHLLPDHDYYLNLGGIANVSHHSDTILSYDVCPCNQILNAEAAKEGLEYDPGGSLASSGTDDIDLMNLWSAMPYFRLDPPKSLDNRWVMSQFYDILKDKQLSTRDALATAVEFCAREIGRSVAAYCPSTGPATMLATGGGAHNDYLIERIAHHLSDQNITVVRPAADIIDNKEAILMSLMGYLRLRDIPNTIPTVTGASRPTIGGALYIPSSISS